MKNILLIMVLMMILPGCMAGAGKILEAQRELIDQIPDNKFSSFEYRRTGYASSASIVAKNGMKVDGQVVVESILMDLNYGPESLLIRLEGYEMESE